MALEIVVGLEVIDDESYQLYREEMIPILETYGGGFHFDFKVSEVLKSKSKDPFNRVFTIYFRDEQAKEEFFSNPEYLKIKEKHFEKAVTHKTVIASYLT